MDNTINVAYASKTSHTSNNGAWIIKKYHCDTKVWDDPVLIASDSSYACYGFALTVDSNGNYVGVYKKGQSGGLLYKAISADHGATWSSSEFNVDGIHQYGCDACSITKLSSGRWIMYIGNSSSTTHRAMVVYSDDEMNTWHGVLLDSILKQNAFEGSFVETSKGVVLIVRDGIAGTKDYPHLFVSTDNAVSWVYKGRMSGIDNISTNCSIWRNQITNLNYIFCQSRYKINGKVRWNVIAVTDADLVNNNIGVNYCVWQKKISNLGDTGYGAIVADSEMNLYWFWYMIQTDNYPKIEYSVINPYPKNSYQIQIN